jgi:hypothetical protein
MIVGDMLDLTLRTPNHNEVKTTAVVLRVNKIEKGPIEIDLYIDTPIYNGIKKMKNLILEEE